RKGFFMALEAAKNRGCALLRRTVFEIDDQVIRIVNIEIRRFGKDMAGGFKPVRSPTLLDSPYAAVLLDPCLGGQQPNLEVVAFEKLAMFVIAEFCAAN